MLSAMSKVNSFAISMASSTANSITNSTALGAPNSTSREIVTFTPYGHEPLEVASLLPKNKLSSGLS